ncbi:FecCD family ABC transporter permease [Streptomyces sp. PR69]|uniref:FecCD family ABC transporter permease n=1 Tax=Streptomyces sp. PR69 TaxID=2984950 RepID=UPI002263C781|nr:iron chelate uptake ABC transporter family permease subunit [Streptomyces sp. PR69]
MSADADTVTAGPAGGHAAAGAAPAGASANAPSGRAEAEAAGTSSRPDKAPEPAAKPPRMSARRNASPTEAQAPRTGSPTGKAPEPAAKPPHQDAHRGAGPADAQAPRTSQPPGTAREPAAKPPHQDAHRGAGPANVRAAGTGSRPDVAPGPGAKPPRRDAGAAARDDDVSPSRQPTAGLLRPSARRDAHGGDTRTASAAPAAAPTAPPAVGRSALSTAALYAAAIVVLVASAAVSVRIGTTDVSYADLAATVGSRLGLDVTPLPPLVDSLIWDLRVPRVLLAALVGAALAVCGAVLQAVTRNALADPYLLGVSSGASTGAAAVVVLGVGVGSLTVAGGAFAGALLSFGLLMLLLRRSGLDSVRVVLTGVVVAQLFTALTSMILMASGDADIIRAVTQWLLGSMASARWDAVAVCAVVTAAGLAAVWLFSAALDGFAFGADTAASLGVDVRRTRLALLVVTSLIAAVAVAAVGAIGFVGLIVPHLVRFLIGPLHRVLLPFSALAGAVFLVWTDALARVAFAPQEVPVGVFTALLGVPLFLLVLRRRGEL